MQSLFFKVRYVWLGAAITALVLSIFHLAGKNTEAAPRSIHHILAGNKRFAYDHPLHPDQTQKRTLEVAQAQHPTAVVITCSDSRVSPELIFDKGLGELFVIRTAGNLISDLETGSVEYAVKHLSVPIIIVMGHERCGAVKAMVDSEAPEGHMKAIIDSLLAEPEIKAVSLTDEQRLDHCIIANVQHGVRQLKAQSEIIAEGIKSGKLTMYGARYDLDDRTVAIIATAN